MADPDPMTCDPGSRVYDPDPRTVIPDPIYLVTTLITFNIAIHLHVTHNQVIGSILPWNQILTGQVDAVQESM